MKKIWKYEIPITSEFRLEIQRGAVVLSVQVQHNVACIWAMVDTDAPKESRGFRLVGTGTNASDVDPARFIGTFQILDGDYVFHLFGVES